MYCATMEEVKRRIILVESLLANQITTGSESYDYELLALNFRKILELVAFSSLIANKEYYSKIHTKFERHYKAKAILESIAKIHPGFYPTPAIPPASNKSNTYHLQITSSPFLQRDEFEELYDKCAKLLHVWSPFDPTPREINFRNSPKEWVEKIKNLLNVHYFQIANSENYWLCVMNSAEDNKVHVYTLKPSHDPKEPA